MGSTFNRGTRDNPAWYVKFKDNDGKWKMRPSKQETKERAKKFLRQVEGRVERGLVGIPEPDDTPSVGAHMDTWSKSLVNRNADDDRGRLKKHLRPKWEGKRIAEITIGAVMDWVDEQRAAEDRLSEGSIRHNLNLLSRFFSWAIERGHATVNPVRQIPQGRRPQQAQKHDVPYLDDDVVVRQIISALPKPIGLMFYLGNRSGLRTGEIAGLRMSDLEFLDEGVIRVRHSYDGPLKEDKGGQGGTGKMKWVPAADDAAVALAPIMAWRRAQGAGPEDYVFACHGRDGSHYRKEYIEQCWDRVAEALKIKLTWYEATRHSFTSRSLAGGASLDEVSAGLGHNSPIVTKRYYDHFVRRTFSAGLRGGLGFTKSDAAGEVVALPRPPQVESSEDRAPSSPTRARR